MRDGATLVLSLPASVADVLDRLMRDGDEAVLVGGCVRDVVRGEQPVDWDVATGAPPELVAQRFPGSSWENRFGTVTVRGADGLTIEVTTYRIEGPYADRRRPDAVRWGDSLADDLARRDFTINAMAWSPTDLAAGVGRLVDPFGGAADLATGVLRAVGDPDERFAEDALRLVRAARFATRFGLTLDAATEAAIRRHADAVSGLSGERVRDELLRIMRSEAAPPSVALLLMERLGLLAPLLPELAALRGVPQSKRLHGDALDHSLRTADALPPGDPILRLAGLVHDIGKATTLADGHFHDHERVGADLAEAMLRRLRIARADATRIIRLVREHMFAYLPEWTDAAVRRFVRRVGDDLLDDLFALRSADNAASGAEEPPTGGLPELQRRVADVIASDPLHARQLAVDGDDLQAIGIPPGPGLGRILDRLLEAVLEDPGLNVRERLLELARGWAGNEPDGAAAHR